MNLLTATESNSNLTPLSEKVATVIGVAETNGIGRFQCGFFMQKIQFYIIMSNWVGQSKDWLDSFVPVRQFCSVRLHNWRYVVGLKTLQTTEAVMPNNNHAQSAPSTESQLIELSQIIGSIADSNTSFTSGLARFIDRTGKPLPEFTLAELIALITLYRDAFNAGVEPRIEQVTAPTQTKSLKTSRFNVLTRTRKLVAERVPFNQAIQYQDCIVKFAGMEA